MFLRAGSIERGICECCGHWLDSTPVNTWTCPCPDEYEKQVGIEKGRRQWHECSCGYHQSTRDYSVTRILDVYEDKYRNTCWRPENVEEAFNRIMATKNSENDYRVRWLSRKFHGKTLLDVGSGFGVFPYAFKRDMDNGLDITCLEPNMQSVQFISGKLKMSCLSGSFERVDLGDVKWDAISMVHVLEHVLNPFVVLAKVRDHLKDNGILFIEVPDSSEFGRLPIDHDEFNSCHLRFFSLPTLARMLDDFKFDVVHAHRVTFIERNLSRILCIARRKDA